MRLVNTSCGCLTAALVAATVAPGLTTAVIAWFFVGLANMTLIAATNTTLQLTARPDMRGRVISLYFLMIMGSTPIGGPITGWVAETLGTRWGMGMAAAAAGAATVLGLAGARGTVTDAPGPEPRPGPLAVSARMAR
jgi:MFS family permease